MSDLVKRLCARHDKFSGTGPGEDERLMSEAVQRISALERTQISPELRRTVEMCEARASRMMRGESAGIGPIVSCLRDVLAAIGEQESGE